MATSTHDSRGATADVSYTDLYRRWELGNWSATEIDFTQPTRVYARPQLLAAGVPMSAPALQVELRLAGYSSADGDARIPGTYSSHGDEFVIASRGYADPAGGELPRELRSEARARSGDECRLRHAARVPTRAEPHTWTPRAERASGRGMLVHLSEWEWASCGAR